MYYCRQTKKIDVSNADFSTATNATNINMFKDCDALTDLYLKENGSPATSQDISKSPLTYDSMLRVAGWLKDLTGQESKNVTFKQSAYNDLLTPKEKATLTPEQQATLIADRQATLYDIIHVQKNWELLTA